MNAPRRPRTDNTQLMKQLAEVMESNFKDRTIIGRYARNKTKQLRWEIEKRAVMRQLTKSDYTAKVALHNPMSVIDAMIESASMGLSMQPSLGHVYLTPETVNDRQAIVAFIGYRGMEFLAISTHAAKHIQTELVYSNDVCRRGMNENGENYIVFEMARGERGELEGCFCRIRLPNNEMHVEWMSAEELDACEQVAIASKNGAKGAWGGPFRAEMQKKCCVRRALKHVRLTEAMQVAIDKLDEAQPMDFDNATASPEEPLDTITPEHRNAIREALAPMPPADADDWMERLAIAWGHTSIDVFPDEAWERMRDMLVTRKKRMDESTRVET